MKTLVTGAGGFVGSNLVEELLQQKEDIRCFLFDKDKANKLEKEKELECIVGDIRNRKDVERAIRGCDKVYHLAAAQNFPWYTFEDHHSTNVLGTVNVMEAAVKYNVKKIVHTSSRVTIGGEGTGIRINENFRHKGFFGNAYALTKYKGEKVALEYCARGLNVTIVNPTLIYGPRDTFTLWPLIKYYLTRKVRFIGFAKTIVNLIYAKDVARGQILAMCKGRPGHRYILGGTEIKIGDFLKLLDKITENKKHVINVPDNAIDNFIKVLGPLLTKINVKLQITKEQIYAMKYDTLVDTTKARNELGLKITPLEKGLKETLNWYKENNYLAF